MESKKLRILNLLSFYTLIGTFFLSIFFFLPYVPVSIEVAKGFLLSVGVTLSIFFWLMARLVDGKFTIPKDRLIIFAGLIPLVFLIASFFSSSLYLSIFGQGFEVGTFGTMLVLFLVLFLSSIYFQTESRIRKFFKAILLGSAIVLVVQFLQLFVGLDKLAPGMFMGVTNGNLLGTWNNFAFLFGGVVVLCLAMIELLPKKKSITIFLTIFCILSLFLLVLVNISFVWILVGIFSLVVFVYSISQNRAEDRTLKNFPYLSFFVVLISLLFLVGSNSLSTIVAQYFGAINPEFYPSVSGTFELVRPALSHNPLFGTGPNTFALDWSMWRPQEIFQSIFWNVDFKSGFGLIPTFLITTGIIGFLAWILFIIVFILRALQSVFLIIKKRSSSHYVILSMFLALYFWIGAFISNPNVVELMLAFAATGVFIGSLVSMNLLALHDGTFLEDPRTSFFSILGLVLLMILSISTCYAYTEKFSSLIYYSYSAPKDTTRESLLNSEAKILKAISLDKNDAYYRGLSQIYLAEIQTVVADKTLSADILKTTTQGLITNTESSVNSAIKQNPKYYMNWKNAGDVYASLLSFGVTGSYESSLGAYTQALTLSPMNPGILLSLSQLEVIHKDTEKAKSYIEEALKVKPNYIDALFARAQLKFDEGDKSGAISDAELAATYAQGDASTYFKLGSLKYSIGDFVGAISAFEMSVRIDPYYHNARYLLGLSYKKAGRLDDAHTQFGILYKLFPDNTEVKNAYNGVETSPTVPQALSTKQIDKEKVTPPLPKKAQ